jgi:hypothetical protein
MAVLRSTNRRQILKGHFSQLVTLIFKKIGFPIMTCAEGNRLEHERQKEC